MNPPMDRRSLLKLLALLPLTSLAGEGTDSSVRAKGPAQNRGAANILILVFDALSAKHMSLYGYERETTPNLDRFAQQSTVFHANYAAGNFTTPGTASLLTGVYPWSHRALHFLGKAARGYARANIFSLFAAAGYTTITYTHNPLVHVLLHQFRQDLSIFKGMQDLCLAGQQVSERFFPSDFDIALHSEWLVLREGQRAQAPGSLFLSLFNGAKRHKLDESTVRREYDDLFPRGVPSNIGPYGGSLYFILEHAIDWISVMSTRSPQPFLAYVHLYPPHEPYHPRREFVGLFDDGWGPEAKPPHFFTLGCSDQFLDQKRREYDEHIAYADAEFGRLYALLEQNGLLDNTYVVITADHGEMFERGIHGHDTETLYESVIRVPLLVSAPKQRQRKDVYVSTSGVDLLPTLLHATDRAVPDWCEGAVLPTFSDSDTTAERSIFCVEAKSNPKRAALTKATLAAVKERYKLIRYLGYDGFDDEYELYDLVDDPEETRNLYSSNSSVATQLQRELAEKLREVNQPYALELH